MCPVPDKLNEPDLIKVGNYLTRHIIKKISGVDEKQKNEDTKATSIKENVKKRKKAKRKIRVRLNVSSNEEQYISKKDQEIVEFTYEPGSTVLVKDAWDVWCEAKVLKKTDTMLQVKYVSEQSKRYEWVAFGNQRIRIIDANGTEKDEALVRDPTKVEKKLSEKTSLRILKNSGKRPRGRPRKYPPNIQNQEIDELGLDTRNGRDVGVQKRVETRGRKLSTLNSVQLGDGWSVYCNQCHSYIEQYRYFCVDCKSSQQEEFDLCSNCYIRKFPKKHEHPRLSFAMECIVNEISVEAYSLKRVKGKTGLFPTISARNNQIVGYQLIIAFDEDVRLDIVYYQKYIQPNILNHESSISTAQLLKYKKDINSKTKTFPGVYRFYPALKKLSIPSEIKCVFCHHKYDEELQDNNEDIRGVFCDINKPFILKPGIKTMAKLAFQLKNKNISIEILKRFYGAKWTSEISALTGKKYNLDKKIKKKGYDMAKELVNYQLFYLDLYWCHSTCSKFINQVVHFKKPTETYYNLSKSVIESTRQKCSKCHEIGATVGCTKEDCKKYFHWTCTNKPKSSFLKGVVFYCPYHESLLLEAEKYSEAFSCDLCSKPLPLEEKLELNDKGIPVWNGPESDQESVVSTLTNLSQLSSVDEEFLKSLENRNNFSDLSSLTELTSTDDEDGSEINFDFEKSSLQEIKSLAYEKSISKADSKDTSSSSRIKQNDQKGAKTKANFMFNLEENLVRAEVQTSPEEEGIEDYHLQSNGKSLKVLKQNSEGTLTNALNNTSSSFSKTIATSNSAYFGTMLPEKNNDSECLDVDIINSDCDILEKGLLRQKKQIVKQEDESVAMKEDEHIDVIGSLPNDALNYSWFSCSKCLNDGTFSTFDLCPLCYHHKFHKVRHQHAKSDFIINNQDKMIVKNYVDSSKLRPAKKRQIKPKLPTIPKELENKTYCAYCWTTESSRWRKSLYGVVLCAKCFSSNKSYAHRNKKSKSDKIGPLKENQESNDKAGLYIKDPTDLNKANSTQYIAPIEDYSHLPYYTRLICAPSQLNSNLNMAKLLDNYEPQPNHWFSLKLNTAYLDIPGRAPRWASHSGGDYHGTWLAQVVRRSLLRYTKPKALVLSNFLGRGTDAIECFLNNRRCVGIDINPVAVTLSLKNCSFALPPKTNLDPKARPTILIGDARRLPKSKLFSDNSFDHVLSHPPYKDCVEYSNHIPQDLSRISELKRFLNEMSDVAKESMRVLKSKGRLTLGIGDNREKCFYIPLGFELIRTYLNEGFILEELIIKRQRQCQMYGLGTYLSSHYEFLILTHEYIAIFRKDKKFSYAKIERYLLEPSQIIYGKDIVTIKVKAYTVPNYPYDRKSKIMGTVWAFKPTDKLSFISLIKSRMVERFAPENTNWEEVTLGFGLDQHSDVPIPPEPNNNQDDDESPNEYEKKRQKKIRDNAKLLLSLGLTTELNDERQDDTIHHDHMIQYKPTSTLPLGLVFIPHIPPHLMSRNSIPYYRKAIHDIVLGATSLIPIDGIIIIGAMDYRFDKSHHYYLMPLPMLIYEDIKKSSGEFLNLKEMIVCVPEGYALSRSTKSSDNDSDTEQTIPSETYIPGIKVTKEVEIPHLPIVHATYLVFIKVKDKNNS